MQDPRCEIARIQSCISHAFSRYNIELTRKLTTSRGEYFVSTVTSSIIRPRGHRGRRCIDAFRQLTPRGRASVDALFRKI